MAFIRFFRTIHVRTGIRAGKNGFLMVVGCMDHAAGKRQKNKNQADSGFEGVADFQHGFFAFLGILFENSCQSIASDLNGPDIFLKGGREPLVHCTAFLIRQNRNIRLHFGENGCRSDMYSGVFLPEIAKWRGMPYHLFSGRNQIDIFRQFSFSCHFAGFNRFRPDNDYDYRYLFSSDLPVA